MTILPIEDRIRVWRGLMRFWSNLRELISGMNKIDLQNAVNATDEWIETNSASFNATLPLPARTSLTSNQKALLFVIVALMRSNPILLKRIFPEVN